VILIDEDTPSDTLDERLDRLARALKISIASLPFKKRSMQGFLLTSNSDVNSLITDVSAMSPPVFVILDSLSMVMGGWNQNSTRDAIRAAEKWNQLKQAGATLFITHHMSLKKEGSYKEFDFTGHAMGNTQLIARCDTAIGMWRIPPEEPTRAIVKAKPRRTALTANKSFAIQLEEAKDKSWALLVPLDELPSEPSEVARRIFPLFHKDQLELYTSDVIDMVKKDYSEVAIREALHELEREGALIQETEKGRQHRYKYKLNPDLVNPYCGDTEYWEQLLQ
jgi:hypothetical protein